MVVKKSTVITGTIILVNLVTLALVLLLHDRNEGLRYPPGKEVVPEAPVQEALKEPKQWRSGDEEISALAVFRLRGRVISTKRYRFGRESAVSPLDVFLVWGPASENKVVEKLRAVIAGRNAYYDVDWGAPLGKKALVRFVGMVHLIPANDEIREKILEISREDTIRLDGYLVEIRASDGWLWKSSLSREDEYAGSSELMWVEKAEVYHPPG